MIKEFQGEFIWLSNFYIVNIEYKNNIYISVENAYQSAKNDSDEWKYFCLINKPNIVKKEAKKIE